MRRTIDEDMIVPIPLPAYIERGVWQQVAAPEAHAFSHFAVPDFSDDETDEVADSSDQNEMLELVKRVEFVPEVLVDAHESIVFDNSVDETSVQKLLQSKFEALPSDKFGEYTGPHRLLELRKARHEASYQMADEKHRKFYISSKEERKKIKADGKKESSSWDELSLAMRKLAINFTQTVEEREAEQISQQEIARKKRLASWQALTNKIHSTVIDDQQELNDLLQTGRPLLDGKFTEFLDLDSLRGCFGPSNPNWLRFEHYEEVININKVLKSIDGYLAQLRKCVESKNFIDLGKLMHEQPSELGFFKEPEELRKAKQALADEDKRLHDEQAEIRKKHMEEEMRKKKEYEEFLNKKREEKMKLEAAKEKEIAEERAAEERAAEERAAKERAAKERAAEERAAEERAAKERAAKEKEIAKERAAREDIEAERLKQEQLRKQAIEKEKMNEIVRKKEMYKEKAAERIRAVIEPQNISKFVLESSDAHMKASRMRFKRIFSGSFNKISSDPEKLVQVVVDIYKGGDAEINKAAQEGWEKEARAFYLYSIAEQVESRASGDQFDADFYQLAFLMSCVVVDLCAIVPGLRDIVLGVLQRNCPLLIPSIITDTVQLDDDSKLRESMGFRPNETVGAFVKRSKNMGIMLAAICQTPINIHKVISNSKKSQICPHLWPMSAAWMWLTRFLNQLHNYAGNSRRKLPLPTAPILEGFLKVAGYELGRNYGKQFINILKYVRLNVVPLLADKATVPHLLDSFLDEIERVQWIIPKPKGRYELEKIRNWGST